MLSACHRSEPAVDYIELYHKALKKVATAIVEGCRGGPGVRTCGVSCVRWCAKGVCQMALLY